MSGWNGGEIHIWAEDGYHRVREFGDRPSMSAMVFPEQVEALERRLGSPVIKVALDDPDNVVWRRQPDQEPTMSAELPPEVQAVLDAAEHLADDFPTPHQPHKPFDYGLRDAVAAYRKSIAPPEPFEAYARWLGDRYEYDGSEMYPLISKDPEEWLPSIQGVWKVTVTPVERVR